MLVLISSAAAADTKRDIQGIKLGMQQSEFNEILHNCKPIAPTHPRILRCEESVERIFEILLTKVQPPRIWSINMKFCSRDPASEVTRQVENTFGHADKVRVTPGREFWRHIPMDEHTVMHFDEEADQLPCPAFSSRYKLSITDRDLARADSDSEREKAPTTPKF